MESRAVPASTTGPRTPRAILADWGARELGDPEDPRAGRAYAVEVQVEQLRGLLSAGGSVVLSGEPGIGKTAIVREVAHRNRTEGHEVRIVQLSARHRRAKMRPQTDFSEAFQELAEAFSSLGYGAIPFFEDADLIRIQDAGAAVAVLASRLAVPVLLEGTPAAMVGLIEDEPTLEEHFVLLPIEEPTMEATREIVRRWTEELEAELPTPVTDDAIDEVLYLGHRFLSRSRFPRKAIDLLHQTSFLSKSRVDRSAVIQRFCELHKTPRWLVDPREPLDIEALEQRFQERLLGQNEAVTATISLISLMKTGLSDLRRPYGTFLFAGPTGVGKTHLTQLLAEVLFGGPQNLIRINLGDYAGDENGVHLFGNPYAYSLADRRGALNQAVAGRPFAVLLFDEIEKAHSSIFDRFLPLMDEGFFTNGAGETVSCRSMIIIATTNAGAEVYRGAGLGFASDQDLDEKRRRVDKAVRETFRFEFLNRFDAVVHFAPLSREDTRTIARWELDGLRDRAGLRRYGLTLQVDEAVLDWLAVHGYHPDFGARFLKRTIERHATRALADLIVRRRPPPGSRLRLSVRANRIRAGVEAPPPAGPAAPAVRGRSVARTPRTFVPGTLARECRDQLDALRRREGEREELLERMNAPGFWSDVTQREETLERFRSIDVQVGIERRLAAPIEAFLTAFEDPEFEQAPNARSLMGQALAALERWRVRLELEGPSVLWIVLSAVDAHHPAIDALKTLARTYAQYGRRCDLHVQVEAIEPHPRGAARVVLEAEGAGALHLLAAEVGLHRFRVTGDVDQSVRVDLVDRGEGAGTPARRRSTQSTAFGFDAEAESVLEVPGLGIASTLWGREPGTLGRLVADLARSLPTWSPDPSLVRVHGEGGSVRDPRTDVVVPVRAVGKGRLEPFCEAYHAFSTEAMNEEE